MCCIAGLEQPLLRYKNDKNMKAITLIPGAGIKVEDVPQPKTPAPEHLIVKIDFRAINPGDIAFISRPFPLGGALSLYNVYGVSGAGTVVATGPGVPERYVGKQVALYRSLKSSDSMVGTWSEYAHLHFLNAVILPDDAVLQEYSGSLVNIITPYAFLKQVQQEGHKAIISTAGTSATGRALVGFCENADFPLISIVRTEKGKQELENLGAKNVIVEDSTDFSQQLREIAQTLGATAVFDGVGGSVLNKMIDVLPNYTSIYTYGYLGGPTPLTFHTSILNAKGLTITSFGNFRSKTVQDPQLLEKALIAISEVIHQPHFKTKIGKTFPLDAINEALQFSSEDGAKAILC
jgi:NADPH:quinone reductase